ncbi:outer membrane protein assembly factor BamB family protein [Bythopirellula polymerisocia]|uniref:Outer membrane biogenesis protein BamB n=1 Tax=Bythopirellula polymerisocia TaxID=2528003 RepID=A0A5C6CA29_9BACT|nr:PQQ-binding-like beta-propeller repeat protein [Bythopirellula polymerisocia]TWU20341.1 outer membrane biogenesis protein BamB [Bythopirellula polymerisocia]
MNLAGAITLLLLSLPSLLSAGELAPNFASERLSNWHQWRGPDADGLSPNGNPPLEWNESTNIKWKVEIPGSGSATPIVWDNRIIILTAVDTGLRPDSLFERSEANLEEETESPIRRGGRKGVRKGGKAGQVLSVPRPKTIHRFEILCLDRHTGEVLWQRTANEAVPHDGHHPTHGYASASPTTDGQKIIASFGSYGIYCYTFDGELLWDTDLGKMQTRRGFGEAISPVLYGDSVLVNWDHEGESFITCLNAKTGEERWRKARDEETTWGTPLIVEHNGVLQVVTNATGRTRSYDLANGELIWECGGQVKSPIPSPIAKKGIVYCMTGYLGYAVNAISLDSAGDITDSGELVWQFDKAAPYVASPLIYDDLLYFTKGETGILLCVDATTGEVVYGPKRLPDLGTIYCSLAGAAKKIYIADRDGNTLVIRHGREFHVLATNSLDESFSASPVIVDNDIFLRGQHHLYCISND